MSTRTVSNGPALPARDEVDVTNASADELMPIVYEQLRALAAKYLSRDKLDQLLEPGVLVNETWIRLNANPPHSWHSVEHFLAVAAKAMRKVLVDHARRRRALKRGFGRARVGLEMITASGPRDVEIRRVDAAIRKLSREHPRAAHVTELRFFAGLTHEQVARVLGVSRKTVVKDWTTARDWLAHELADEGIPRNVPVEGY